MRIGAFEVGEEIGRGGMGAVYLARHASDGVDVALKILDEMQSDMDHAFDLEVQAMARLNHRSIAMVVDAGRLEAETARSMQFPPNSPWIAMEFVRGDELATLRGALGWDEIRDFALGVLDALAHSHSLGVVHRDIKPQNIIIARTFDRRVDPKLVDFGIALPIEDLEIEGGDPTDKTVIGTPRYMAPEQVAAAWAIQGPPTDLYSLACVIWELATGSAPFDDKAPYVLMLRHLKDPPPTFRPRIPVPLGLERWLRRMLEKGPMERFRRAADAAHAFRALGDVTVLGDEEPTEVEEDWKTMREVAPVADLPEPVRRPWHGTYDRPPIPEQPRERSADSRMTLVGSGLGLVGMRTMPLVGRRSERDALWQALLAADRACSPQPVVLRGPAGVGKSRLAEWFSRHADEVGGAQVLRVLHSEDGGAADGLGPALIRHMRCKGLEVVQASEFIQRWLADRMENPSEPLAESLLSIVISGYGEVNTSAFFMDPAERYRIFTEFLDVLCRERPVVLWIDDAQWGRDAVELAHHLMTAPKQLPVVIVVTMKDDNPDNPAERRAIELGEMGTSMHVEPLDETEQIALVRQMLGLSLSLARTVAERTGGNPLFATQLVRSWVAGGALVAADDGLVLSASAPNMPDDVHALLADEFDRIIEGFLPRAPDANERIELLATLGSEVVDAELAALAGADRFLVEEMMRALAFGGLVERTEDGWRFSTSLFRESLERRAREAGRSEGHHRRCADLVRDFYDDHAVGIAARRARHLLGAKAYAEAIAPLLVAADLAVGESVAEARQLLELLDDAIERVGEDTSRARAHARLIRGSVELIAGNVDQVLVIAAEVAEEAEAHGWKVELGRAHSQRANVLSHQGKPAEALAAYELASAALEGESPEALARHLVSLGVARRRANDVAGAIDACARAVQIYEDLERDRELINARSELGCSMLGHGQYDEARELLRRAARDAAALGSAQAQWRALLLEGLLEILAERWDAARGCFDRANDVFDVQGVPKTVAELHEAFVEACDGDVDVAEATLHRAVATFERIGLRFEVPSMLTALGICAARREDWETCASLIRRAQHGITETGATSLLVATGADTVAGLARNAGESSCERVAHQLAQSQWVALGHPRAGSTRPD